MVRPAVPADASALARVLVDTYRVAHRGQVPDRLLDFPPIEEAYATSERNWLRTLSEIASTPNHQERVFVAVDGERVVGLGMGQPRKLPEREFAEFAGEVVTLYVLPAHQRRGVGRRLLRAIFRHLVDVGLSSVVIECLSANAPARHFYEAVGGTIVGERIIHDDGSLLPATVYGWREPKVAWLLDNS